MVAFSCSDCCRPIEQSLHCVVYARCSYVREAVFSLETSHPEAVEQMMPFGNILFQVEPDGKVYRESSTSGRTLWWAPQGGQLTELWAGDKHMARSGASWAIQNADGWGTMTQPYCAEAPAAILDIVRSEPAGAIAVSYRRYIKTVWLPEAERVAECLRKHAAVIECVQQHFSPCPVDHRRLYAPYDRPGLWTSCGSVSAAFVGSMLLASKTKLRRELRWPSAEWLTEHFPDIPWIAFPNSRFGHTWIAHVQLFHAVLKEWQEGIFTNTAPVVALAFGGLLKAIE